MPADVDAIGIPWYSREDYPRILTLMEDAHLLPRTFDDWLERAEKTRKKLLRGGAVVVKAHIEPDAFAAWCANHNCRLDAGGRMAFANFIALQYAAKAK